MLGKGAFGVVQRGTYKDLKLCPSPFITRLIGYTTESEPSILLEYVDAGDLQHTKVNYTSIEITWVFANALVDMHSNEIIHRDLKSSIVLLCSKNYIKLGDLGIATNIRTQLTKYVGTRLWNAPEHDTHLYRNWVNQCLAHDPNKRPSAQEICEILEECIGKCISDTSLKGP
ncbi:hypothetical protein THRCLA_01882 [Thraustotheca clavata]|uniref:Protein kinase domain-containing protein n=1 Tax=Thraustotheca clavata TaxID=74557 RepID=A0A1W0A7S7_9STRA|nr:hypothetical protein THRCLA_01882 [Thraustotheca clavata]